MSRCFAAAAVGLGLLLGQASAQERRDPNVFQDVIREVRRDATFTIFDDIHASVEGGVVTLSGKVTSPHKRRILERRITGVRGVREVHNKVAVLPVSVQDEELRYRIARAIYGHPTFWQYAAMVNPPIHIIVERGRVTLKGVVQNNVERMLARSLAASFDAFAVHNELETEAEILEERRAARPEL
jgi:hyperosmotically inducible periplasmic protein